MVEAKKVFSDSIGNQTNAKLNDWLEVGILGESDLNGERIEIPILIEKVLITDALTTFTYNIDQKPIKAGIDPMNKFVDRIVDDNLIKVEF